ncbi:tRNA lysidine(34) synthetase TilS [Crocinitomicaceae bacterium CZZ-1]|uniref:tRNA(Ile)-lysidine synthase n=1 Tax=Taishania pollutisoli TaxID=2766479 RepID=A0A8J6TTA8_9FLAO|nr:tRNA lysidine(34) synthetase TilS [Taishania pollutisoli]MBC9812862.1 tRNA lysidine(34) synthetase TilS [Taishania pollutisoli]
MWEQVLIFMEQYRHQTIYVGCSGGVDSIVLAHFLHAHQFRIHLLHVNYHQRGSESDADMELVKTVAQQYSVPFSVKHYTRQLNGNFQENARVFRYAFFDEMALQTDGVIALAHHADDQTETFFMHLMRQSGIPGLACMPEKRERIVRPFLHLSKEELYQYAINNQLVWREDLSNQSTRYLRNKWRLEYIPLMKKTVPDLQVSVEVLVHAFQQTQRRLEQNMHPVSAEVFTTGKLTKEAFQSLSDEEAFELWRQLKQPSGLFPRFLELKQYTKGKYIEVNYPFTRIIHEGKYIVFVTEQQQTLLPRLIITPVAQLPRVFSKTEVYLNPEKVSGDLVLRNWEQGDRISPIGVSGSQLVSQVIKDAKIPSAERKKVLVVCDAKTIHWVVNLKIGKAAISKPGDPRIIKIELQDPTN